jgi:hypothetical protein
VLASARPQRPHFPSAISQRGSHGEGDFQRNGCLGCSFKYAAGWHRLKSWLRPLSPAVKVGPLNSDFATKVHPDRLPLRPRRHSATQDRSADMPCRFGLLPRPGAAAWSITPTVAPHTFRVRYLSEDPMGKEIFSEMASWQPLLAALERAWSEKLAKKFAQEFWIWGGSLGTVNIWCP